MATDLVQELKRLASLHGRGLLNEDEFREAKQQLIESASAPTTEAHNPVTKGGTARAPGDPEAVSARAGLASKTRSSPMTTRALAAIIGSALLLLAVATSGGSERGGQDPSTSAQQISSRMTDCVVSMRDGTITGSVNVRNLTSEPVSVRASLILQTQGVRVGEGSSFTTLRPQEEAELSIIGGSSRWPRTPQDHSDFRCAHDAEATP